MNVQTDPLNALQSASAKGGTLPLVSIVIPSYNSSAFIARCLRSLERQVTRFPFEVIVVDSSSDGTGALVRDEFPSVRLISRAHQTSCGEARNLGIRAVKGDIVLFIDTDCKAVPDWIETMATLLSEGGADAVSGAMGNGTPHSISGTVGYYLEFFRFMPFDAATRDTDWIVGGNSGFRREVLEGFQYPDANLGDDFLFSFHLRNSGRSLCFAPRAVVEHLNRTGFRKVWSYQVKIGEAAVRYRETTSPKVMAWFSLFPLLAWFTIPVVYIWVSLTVLRRCGAINFLWYLGMTPVVGAMIFGWAFGFFRAARASRSARRDH